MLLGYARVSTFDQDTSMQISALRRAGCSKIFQEKQSAVKHRPELERVLASLTSGDVLVVYKLDRLARSLSHLLRILEQLQTIGAGVRSVTEPIDTCSPAGRMMLQILGSVAEFERSLIRERSIAGQIEAMRRGVIIGGRPKKLSDRQVARAKAMRDRGATWYAIADALDCSHTTARRAVVGDERDRMKVLRQYM